MKNNDYEGLLLGAGIAASTLLVVLLMRRSSATRTRQGQLLPAAHAFMTFTID